jgi:hypothetical protein
MLQAMHHVAGSLWCKCLRTLRLSLREHLLGLKERARQYPEDFHYFAEATSFQESVLIQTGAQQGEVVG